VLSAVAFKSQVVVRSLMAFVLMSTVTALTVRTLLSSGVVIMFPMVMLLERMGLQGVDMQQMLALSYPWLGLPIEHLRNRNKPVGPFIMGHIMQMVVFYTVYNACLLAWSYWLYGKTMTTSLQQGRVRAWAGSFNTSRSSSCGRGRASSSSLERPRCPSWRSTCTSTTSRWGSSVWLRGRPSSACSLSSSTCCRRSSCRPTPGERFPRTRPGRTSSSFPMPFPIGRTGGAMREGRQQQQQQQQVGGSQTTARRAGERGKNIGFPALAALPREAELELGGGGGLEGSRERSKREGHWSAGTEMTRKAAAAAVAVPGRRLRWRRGDGTVTAVERGRGPK
ncbi:unnamed protein product, partial [Ectocarpus sp. 13 AM-2016]